MCNRKWGKGEFNYSLFSNTKKEDWENPSFTKYICVILLLHFPIFHPLGLALWIIHAQCCPLYLQSLPIPCSPACCSSLLLKEIPVTDGISAQMGTAITSKPSFSFGWTMENRAETVAAKRKLHSNADEKMPNIFRSMREHGGLFEQLNLIWK